MAITISAPSVVLVEGQDERRAIPAIIRRRNLQYQFDVLSFDGKPQLPAFLKALVRAPGFHKVASVGLIVDADNSHAASFQSAQAALRNVGLPVPNAPLALIQGNPSTAVLVLPGGNQAGMLEDVLFASIAAEPAASCVNAYLDCLHGTADGAPVNLSKAKLHAFLSSRAEPGKRPGEAMEAGYFPAQHIAFDPIVQLVSLL